MAIGHTSDAGKTSDEGNKSDEGKTSAQASSDRLWILVNARERESATATPGERARRQTVVVRDGAKIFISVDVGRRSALAASFDKTEPGCADATLVVRITSASTPCAGCVDAALLQACAARRGLDAASTFRAVRAAIARCAERARAEPSHRPADAGGPPPASVRRGPIGAGRLAPSHAPRALARECEMDVLLIA